jgi:hypothetical protein
MVNRGEVVVNCVVNRGAWRTLFCGLKFSSFLKYIFAADAGEGQCEDVSQKEAKTETHSEQQIPHSTSLRAGSSGMTTRRAKANSRSPSGMTTRRAKATADHFRA